MGHSTQKKQKYHERITTSQQTLKKKCIYIYIHEYAYPTELFFIGQNQHKTKTDSLVLKKVMLETLFQRSTHSNKPKKVITKGRE